MKNNIQLIIDGLSYQFDMVDNPTTQHLMKLFPLTLEMNDFHQNEKVGTLGESLPTQAKPYQKIQAGDVMLYGNDALVIFYKTFKSGYSYTRLGRIHGDMTELNHRGSIQVSLELN